MPSDESTAILTAILDIKKDIVRVETKVDLFADRVGMVEARIDALESQRDQAKGALWMVNLIKTLPVVGAFFAGRHI